MQKIVLEYRAQINLIIQILELAHKIMSMAKVFFYTSSLSDGFHYY